ncbi:hypothetical protein NEF87_003965 [Candidatus Lokiarchaeum ossiferum]|uniref:Right handed beta helix domain-containing protein n=1 Tax=Candidatus Lokiarchaeum ossiferum TaxID=2951803 RepID=A0ABY6HVX9_9ARCH|nr:hypothetical protein NEF87_003965 [Candidatus Lokiarchaeum sp. B-35]
MNSKKWDTKNTRKYYFGILLVLMVITIQLLEENEQLDFDKTDKRIGDQKINNLSVQFASTPKRSSSPEIQEIEGSITINGTDNFSQLPWITGKGTETEPYRITNLEIDMTNFRAGLQLFNIHKYMLIEHLKITKDKKWFQTGPIDSIYGQYSDCFALELWNCSKTMILDCEINAPEAFGIWIENSTEISIANSTIKNTDAGIATINSNNISALNNIIRYTNIGFGGVSCNTSTFSHNKIYFSTEEDVALLQCNNVTITDNEIYYCEALHEIYQENCVNIIIESNKSKFGLSRWILLRILFVGIPILIIIGITWAILIRKPDKKYLVLYGISYLLLSGLFTFFPVLFQVLGSILLFLGMISVWKNKKKFQKIHQFIHDWIFPLTFLISLASLFNETLPTALKIGISVGTFLTIIGYEGINIINFRSSDNNQKKIPNLLLRELFDLFMNMINTILCIYFIQNFLFAYLMIFKDFTILLLLEAIKTKFFSYYYYYSHFQIVDLVVLITTSAILFIKLRWDLDNGEEFRVKIENYSFKKNFFQFLKGEKRSILSSQPLLEENSKHKKNDFSNQKYREIFCFLLILILVVIGFFFFEDEYMLWYGLTLPLLLFPTIGILGIILFYLAFKRDLKSQQFKLGLLIAIFCLSTYILLVSRVPTPRINIFYYGVSFPILVGINIIAVLTFIIVLNNQIYQEKMQLVGYYIIFIVAFLGMYYFPTSKWVFNFPIYHYFAEVFTPAFILLMLCSILGMASVLISKSKKFQKRINFCLLIVNLLNCLVPLLPLLILKAPDIGLNFQLGMNTMPMILTIFIFTLLNTISSQQNDPPKVLSLTMKKYQNRLNITMDWIIWAILLINFIGTMAIFQYQRLYYFSLEIFSLSPVFTLLFIQLVITILISIFLIISIKFNQFSSIWKLLTFLSLIVVFILELITKNNIIERNSYGLSDELLLDPMYFGNHLTTILWAIWFINKYYQKRQNQTKSKNVLLIEESRRVLQMQENNR